MLSINPDAATREDVARLAAELMDALADLSKAQARLAELETHNFKQRALLRDLWRCPDCLRHFTGDGMAYPYSEACKCAGNPYRQPQAPKDEVKP
jgi:hypothetical protein